jgi:hypothetical protein
MAACCHSRILLSVSLVAIYMTSGWITGKEGQITCVKVRNLRPRIGNDYGACEKLYVLVVG